jgi:hypothetical protein
MFCVVVILSSVTYVDSMAKTKYADFFVIPASLRIRIKWRRIFTRNLFGSTEYSSTAVQQYSSTAVQQYKGLEMFQFLEGGPDLHAYSPFFYFCRTCLGTWSKNY